MVSFLERLADDLLERNKGDLSEVCLVFPTRRAGLHFKKILSQKTKIPIWSPLVYSIEDFIKSCAKVQVPDQLTLIFELYAVYKKYFPAESFDQFYPWGVMLLKDFDDADRSMADTKQLFAYISDSKSIDERFDLDEEEKQRLEEFWKTFFGSEHGPIRKSFLENWMHLGSVYDEFKKALLDKHLSYEGLSARTVAEQLALNAFSLPYKSIVFAGFYALSKAEESIINHFVKNGTGLLFWDADTYYTNDKRQEAGAFLRKSSLIKGEYNWKETLLENDEKKIEMIGVPMQVLQAKVAGQLLLEEIIQKQLDPEHTAVVLPDEQLLFPVLYSLPQGITDINITMGYPLKSSPLFNLIEALFDMQHSIREGKETSFYYKNVMSVLTHPYIQFIEGTKVNEWVENYRKVLSIRISLKELVNENSPRIFKVLFRKINHLNELCAYFNELFSLMIQTLRQNKAALNSIEKEYIYHFYTQFKRLEDIVSKHEADVTMETFRSLFREVIYATRIPFAGEPLKGLQVMGFLETRVLDFENLIILSVNEDSLPPSSRHPSFIPFSIRKIFGLPTYEDNNAIAAYHFYRLLQRAKNIYLIYNTEVKSIQAGERSRYLLQIENELCRKNSKIKLVKKIAGVDVTDEKVPPVIIDKSPDVLKSLQSYFVKSNQPVKYARKFSASALTTYITCSLRFYFQYLIKLKEVEEPEERIEGSLFGTILHEAMQSLYHSHKIITASDFEQIDKIADRAVDEAIKKHFSAIDSLEGKNILMRKVIIELVKQIIDFDKRSAPLTIRALEQEASFSLSLGEGKPVILYGIIDRVDEIQGSVRIVDYKTGKTEDKKAPSIAALFESPDYKEQFQTFFYSYLYSKTKISTNGIKAGLFRLRKLSEGIKYINNGELITSEQYAEFESHLLTLLNKIFSTDFPFVQTKDEKQCIYCPYKDICNR